MPLTDFFNRRWGLAAGWALGVYALLDLYAKTCGGHAASPEEARTRLAAGLTSGPAATELQLDTK